MTWGAPIEASVSGVPIGQLARSTYAVFESNNLRVREFDAATSLIAPAQTAWQIISRAQPVGLELAHFFGGVAPQETARTVADQYTYNLYHFDLGSRLLAEAQQARQVAAVPTTATTQLITLPAQFGATLDLIGFNTLTTTTSNEFTLLTYWQITAPTDQPLQLFVHVLDAEGQIVAQHDGFGARPADWQPGDIVAQMTRLDLPDHFKPGTIEVGWYDQSSLQRLPLSVGGQSAGNRLLLP